MIQIGAVTIRISSVLFHHRRTHDHRRRRNFCRRLPDKCLPSTPRNNQLICGRRYLRLGESSFISLVAHSSAISFDKSRDPLFCAEKENTMALDLGSMIETLAL